MRKLQSISFNLTDDEEMALYEHAMKKKYFSRYIKGLITQDKIGEVVTILVKEEVVEDSYIEETPKKITKRDSLDDIFGFF